MDRAERVDRARGERLDRVGVRDVGAHRDRRDARAGERGGGALERLRLDVGEDDAHAFRAEPLREREPDPARGSGHDGGLARELHQRNFGRTCAPISSIVCITLSCGILYGFTRQSSRSTPAAS